jgi:hypothetical protein
MPKTFYTYGYIDRSTIDIDEIMDKARRRMSDGRN